MARPNDSSSIHPSAVIGDGVELGTGVAIGPHAVVLGPARVGDRCWIGPGVVIGTPPEVSSLHQSRGWDGELDHAGVEIGEDTVVRELSTIHQGSARTTSVGARCWLLNRCYVAHDVQVGDDVTLSAGVSVGGHVRIGRRANLGMNASVHQRRLVGPGVMVGMGAVVTRDLPPFALAYGSPAHVRGVNAVGLQRAGHDPSLTEALAGAYADGRSLAGEDSLAGLGEDLAWWVDADPQRPAAAPPR